MAQEPQETQLPGQTPPAGEKKKGVRVYGPDNRYYQFPEGTTKEAAVSFFKKKGILSPESPRYKPTAPAPGATPPAAAAAQPQAGPKPEPTYGQKMDIEARNEMEAISRFRPRWDTPEAILQDPTWYGRSARYLGGELVGVGKAGATMAVGGAKLLHDIASALDPIEGYKRPIGEPQAEVGRDVVDIGKGIIDVGKATWDMLKHFPEAEADPQKLGETLTNVAMLVDGGMKMSKAVAENMSKAPKANVKPTEALTKAHEFTSGAPSRLIKRRAFEDAYVHAKGLELSKKITKAGKAIHEEVKTHADGIAKQIDGKLPTGVVDAAGEAATILKEFNDIVKTPDKAHPVLVQMVRDAAATSPKLWSWEKARQFRSSVGRSINKVEGPQEVVLTRIYKDLTDKLGGAAKKYGLGKSWDHYNELSKKVEQQYGDLIDDVHKAQSGQEVAQKLGKDVALTSEMAGKTGLTKYGLSHAEVLDFVKTAKRVLRDKNAFNKTLFRLVYGSPAGAVTMISMRLMGAPWMAGLGAGALVGAVSTYVVNLVRAMKMSPDVIEHMMTERELPGRMKLDEGTFPEGEASPEGAPETPPEPKALPEPPGEPEIERLRRLGAGKPPAAPLEPQGGRLTRLASEAPLKQAPDADPKLLEAERKKGLASMKKEGKPSERWYRDKGSIPGEPVEFLDVPGDDLDKAKAAIVEHESPKGTKFEAIDAEGKSLGTFDHMEQAKAAAEGKVMKAEPGKHGTGKLAEQAKARERVRKPKTDKEGKPVPEGAGRSAQKNVEEAHARARATGLDVSQLQIPELEEFVRLKNPTAWRGLQKLRKAKSVPDQDYKSALEYLALEHLEE